jgi:two-component sensor histidine kinase
VSKPFIVSRPSTEEASRPPLEQIITTVELQRRPSRAPNYEAENRAPGGLVQAIADQPVADLQRNSGGASTLLQKLVDTALDLCRGHSAGASLLENDDGQEVFRCRAAVGKWSVHLNEAMPRESPCGIVIKLNKAVLMAYPERRFTCARNATLPIAEALLISFHPGGRPVGTIWVICHDGSDHFDAEDRRLLMSLGRFAANAYHLLNEEKLAAELDATRRLQEISSQLLGEEQVEELYEKIAHAASVIMLSDFASMQMLYPERARGELRLPAFRGFNGEAAKHWEWVRAGDASTCGPALRTRARVTASDVEACSWMAGREDLEVYRRTDIRAVQTTPLVSRGGELLGMICTHCARPCNPSEEDFRLFDALARQAADLLERSLTGQRTKMLFREDSHRGKNLLAVVQAMARQTVDTAEPQTFSQQFSTRLAGLAAIQELLVKDEQLEANVRELICSQLPHLEDLAGSRTALDGPAPQITSGAAQTIGMAIHELSTNAVKYGALSNLEGMVEIRWGVSYDPSPVFTLSWHERVGPAVKVPQRQGFGHTIIVRMVEYSLDASVALDYAPTGLQWKFTAPTAGVLAGK